MARQMSFDDLGMWCSKHKRYDCPYHRGAYIDGVEEAIIEAMRLMRQRDIHPIFVKHLMAWLEMEVSKNTIYRRLERLERKGVVKRVHAVRGFQLVA